MKKDNIVFQSVRLNVNNQEHLAILDVLNNLDSSYKSKNQFFIDAVNFYIEHIGAENITLIGESEQMRSEQYITKQQLNQMFETFKQELMLEMMKEIVKTLGSAFVGGAIVSTKEEKADDSKDEFYDIEEDDTLQGLADQWS